MEIGSGRVLEDKKGFPKARPFLSLIFVSLRVFRG
jgi:hypothetical protein